MDKQTFGKPANRNEKTCLTLDCQGINPNGPGRFRTRADNGEEQTTIMTKWYTSAITAASEVVTTGEVYQVQKLAF